MSQSPMPKLLRQEAAIWAAMYGASLVTPNMTPDKAIVNADRGIAALRERMRPMTYEHHQADREAQRDADELAAKTR